jgi:DNA-binding transcriptional LysR family regulator
VEDRRLKTFLTVAQLGSFSRAAKTLYVTQSTVTARIGELEKDLGCRLFIREARGVSLTEGGRLFLRYAQRCLQSLEDGRAAIASMNSGERGYVRIMACHVPATYDLPRLLARYSPEGAELQFSFQTGSSKRIFREVLRGEVDIGLVNVRFRHPDIKTELIAERPLAVVIDREATYGSSRSNLPVFFFEEEMEDALQARLISQQLGLADSVSMGIADMSALKSMINYGLGIGILPREAVISELEKGLLQHFAADALHSLPKQITCLIERREGMRFSPAVDRFMKAIFRYYQELSA